jgi:hypothetical protein
MNTLAKGLTATSIYVESWLMILGVHRVPAGVRDRVPDLLDLPSVASNIAASVAITGTGIGVDRMIRWSQNNNNDETRKYNLPVFSALTALAACDITTRVEINNLLTNGLEPTPFGEVNDFYAGVGSAILLFSAQALNNFRTRTA